MPDPIITDYFYGDESQQFTYFRIPRLLITSPRFRNLTTDASDFLLGKAIAALPPQRREVILLPPSTSPFTITVSARLPFLTAERFRHRKSRWEREKE